jgi:hypothetical protein
MKNIFVFCAGDPKARANFRKTILNPISDDCVFSNTPAEKHAELRSWREEAGGFFAWGIRVNQRTLTMLRTVEAGDCVLGFFDFHYRAISRLVGKLQSDELAEKVWGKPKGAWTWGSIIFITRPREIAVPASSLQPYLCSSYRGATRIGSERVKSIIRDFGSVDTFVKKSFGTV